MARRHSPSRGHIDPDTTKGWLARVWPVVWAHRLLLVVSLTTALGAVVTQVLVPTVVARAIHEGLELRSTPIEHFVVLLAGLGLLRGALSFTYRTGLYQMAYRIECDLRSLLYRHLTTLSFGFYDRVQSGQIISRANSDIRSVQMFLAFAPLISLSVLSFFLALTFMLRMSIPLTVASVLCLPGVFVLGVALRNRIFPLSWVVQSRTADLATIVDENINGVRVVKSFAQEHRQINELAHAARRLQWANIAAVDARSRYTPVMENLPRVGLAVVLLYGGWLVIDGQLDIGSLVAFTSYIVMMQVPFRLLGFFMMLQQRAAASAGRIYELLDEVPEITDRPGAIDLDSPAGQVEYRDVRFGYADGPDVLDGFSLTVDPGETVAIVGATGSGKSTIARLLPRFYDVRDGEVRVDGHDVRELSLASLRASIGMVLDEPFLFSATVRDNIAYGRPDATDEEVVAAATAAQAHAFVTQLADGYESVLGERGYTLSGGQRQRIAIARTLLVNPRILVLDDATSAIDVQVEQEIHAALEALLAGRTTIVIAHRLSTIALADRVVLVEGGRVVASGTHTGLLATEPRYAAVLAQGDRPAAPAEESGEEDDVRYRMRIAMQIGSGRGDGAGSAAPPIPGGL